MLIMNIDNFSLNAKNKVFNNDGKLLYWSQPDFAYKNRLHVYDDSDAEIGYIQYKILSSQKENEIYDADDKRIDVSSFSIIENRMGYCLFVIPMRHNTATTNRTFNIGIINLYLYI